MGCIDSRESSETDKIKFISKENFLQKKDDFVPIDCSIDSPDGKLLAEEIYRF